MAKPQDDFTLAQRRESIKGQIASLGDLRPGSLAGRYRKCGKPNCHCALRGSRGHGPSWSLTRQVDGKTLTRIIPPGEPVERTRQQVAEYRRFRQLSEELVQVSEQICESQMAVTKAERAHEVEKKGSKKDSRPRSATRSKRS